MVFVVEAERQKDPTPFDLNTIPVVLVNFEVAHVQAPEGYLAGSVVRVLELKVLSGYLSSYWWVCPFIEAVFSSVATRSFRPRIISANGIISGGTWPFAFATAIFATSKSTLSFEMVNLASSSSLSSAGRSTGRLLRSSAFSSSRATTLCLSGPRSGSGPQPQTRTRIKTNFIFFILNHPSFHRVLSSLFSQSPRTCPRCGQRSSYPRNS